jgi:hypothetical protein
VPQKPKVESQQHHNNNNNNSIGMIAQVAQPRNDISSTNDDEFNIYFNETPRMAGHARHNF